MEEKATGGTSRLLVHRVPVDNSVIRAEAKYGSKAVFYKLWAIKQLYDWSPRVWRMFRGNVVEEFAQIPSEAGDRVWLRKTPVKVGGGPQGRPACGRRNGRRGQQKVYKRQEEPSTLTATWGCHHWLDFGWVYDSGRHGARLYFHLSFSLSSFSLFELLGSDPASVVMFPTLFSYLLSLMCRAASDRLITRYLNSDQISTTNRLHAVFGGSYEIPCFDQRNKRTAELQVRGADGMIDVFVWSFSVPNGRAATHQTAASILLPRRCLLHAEFCCLVHQPIRPPSLPRRRRAWVPTWA